MTPLDTPKLAVNVEGAAELATLPERTIWREIAANRLRSFKVGKRRLIRVADLSDYLERRSVLAAKERAR